MNVVPCLVLLFVCGMMFGDVLAVPASTNKPCWIRGALYKHHQLTDTVCQGCVCWDGIEKCVSDPCSTETSQPPAESRCYVAGKWYNSGQRTGDPCGRCRCSKGRQFCSRNYCIINGEYVPTPQ